MKAKILGIRYNGFTFEVEALIDESSMTFYTTHPTDEELAFHCQKQWEMVCRARRISAPFKDAAPTFVGKEYDLKDA